MTYETCQHCGLTLLWNGERLLCPRRGCSGSPATTQLTLTDLRSRDLACPASEAAPRGGCRRRGSSRRPAVPPSWDRSDGETLTPTKEESMPDNPPTKRNLVATESFTALYDGERVEITAGADSVAPGHPIARAHPDKFKVAPPIGHRSRTAPKAKPVVCDWDDDYLPPPTWALGFSAPLHRTGELPELLSTISPTVVKLSRHALDGLQAATRAVPHTHETGGLLVGLRPRGDAITKVIEAHPPGPSSLLGRSSFGLDYRVEHRNVKDRRLAGWGTIAVAGSWHSHPRGSTEPSIADLTVWTDAWSHANGTACGIVDRYVGLIVTDVGQAHAPALTAWVLRRKPWAGLVVEPATLDVVGPCSS